MSSRELTLQDLLVVEDDPTILAFSCAETGIPVWTQIRIVLLRMIMSDLLYGTNLNATTAARAPARRAIGTLSRSIVHNTQSRVSGRSRGDVCLVATGIGNQPVDGKWLNRLSDQFALACHSNTTTLEGHFEWNWPFPRHNERVIFHAPLQAFTAVAGRLRLREAHAQQADALVDIVLARAERLLEWRPGASRARELRTRLSRRIAAMPYQYRAYQALLNRVQPRILIVEEACYGNTATLIAAARRRGIVTAEYQHGAVSSGHDAYNFAPAVRESAAYQQTLPHNFLGYGTWWNEQFNAPLTKIVIGNPNREAALARAEISGGSRCDLLILSDGIEFDLYLELAKQIAPVAARSGLNVVLRAHPLERSVVAARYGDRVDEVTLDKNANLYTSLRSAHVVVSEVSTGLFEAVGLADKLFVWNTPKARFGYPRHPFQTFSSAAMLAELLASDSAGRLPASDLEAIWAPSWRTNYLGFLEAHGVYCVDSGAPVRSIAHDES